MKTFIKILTIALLVIEILAALAVCVGILFRSLNLSGARELNMLGFTMIALIYLLKAITPFYKRYISTSPVMNKQFTLLVRRLIYICMMLYALALVFITNAMEGFQQMMKIGFSAATGISFIVVILLIHKRERMEVFLAALIRMICLFFVHWIITTSTPMMQ
jgi:hypothetical protein